MGGTYVQPHPTEKAYTCPHCGTLAPQTTQQIVVAPNFTDGMKVSHCSICNQFVIWREVWPGRPTSGPTFPTIVMVYPRLVAAPEPNEDLPEGVKADFEEARQVFQDSPRSPAALLRLCIQKLCKELGQPGKNINDDIAALVAGGMTPLVQKAMDTVRIAGNEAVHPGELNLNDDADTAFGLFNLVNLIAHDRLTTPRIVEELYARMPESKRNAVDVRDAGSS